MTPYLEPLVAPRDDVFDSENPSTDHKLGATEGRR